MMDVGGAQCPHLEKAVGATWQDGEEEEGAHAAPPPPSSSVSLEMVL